MARRASVQTTLGLDPVESARVRLVRAALALQQRHELLDAAERAYGDALTAYLDALGIEPGAFSSEESS